MSYNSNLPEDIDVKVSRSDVRENLRALKEDKIVDAATAVVADSAAKLTTARKISLEGDATGSTSFDGSADVAIQVDVLSADTATKLETARTINGVSFDGTKDITITVPTMPIGSIIMWPSATLPGGNDEGKWLVCNGQSTDSYPELATIVGAHVPDYQGCFLRGAGSVTSKHFGTVTHSSGALGELQGDSIRNIYGNIGPIQFTQSHLQHNGGVFYTTQDSTYGWGESDLTSKDYATNYGQGYFPLWLDASRVVPTANEIRPVNRTVIYLIKAKQ